MGSTQGDRNYSTPASRATSMRGHEACVDNVDAEHGLSFAARLQGMCGGVTLQIVTLAGRRLDWEQELDCEGLLCPLPVLRARKRLIAMAPGQRLGVRTTDRMALIDLPHFCAEAGHEYLEARDLGGVVCHVIRRGGAER